MRWKKEIVALIAPFVLAACSKLNPNPATATTGQKFFAVTVESTSFYRYGPQQGNGPDKKLDKGELMTLIRPSFGYCKVKLKSGEQGFVANEDIGVASPALIAAVTTPPQLPGVARFRLDSTDPRLTMPPEPLPEILPEPTPIPGLSPDN